MRRLLIVLSPREEHTELYPFHSLDSAKQLERSFLFVPPIGSTKLSLMNSYEEDKPVPQSTHLVTVGPKLLLSCLGVSFLSLAHKSQGHPYQAETQTLF